MKEPTRRHLSAHLRLQFKQDGLEGIAMRGSVYFAAVAGKPLLLELDDRMLLARTLPML